MATMKDLSMYVQEHLREYLPEEMQGAQIAVTDVQKNNGLPFTGVTVRLPGTNVMPVLYLNNYVRHPFGEINESEFPGVCRHIAEEERKIGPQQDIDLSHVMTAEYLEGNSALALVNTEKNEEMLRGVPHEDFRDLSIIAKCSLDVPAKMDGAVTVDNRMLQEAGISKEELFTAARENMLKRNDPVIHSMGELLSSMGMEAGMSEGELEGMESVADPSMGGAPMFVCTNRSGFYGAAVILLPEVQKKMAKICGGDYYILPSSVHETICLPRDKAPAEPEMLQAMVQDINATEVAPEDVLSDSVYRFDSKEMKIDIEASPSMKKEMSM